MVQGLRIGEKSSRDHRNLGGIYLGKVEYNLDPEKLGRIKVRVHGIDPPQDKCSTHDLSWARPCFLGASSDAGTFVVPLSGSHVWVAYESGFYQRPIYLGSYFGKLEQTPKYSRNQENLPFEEITMLPQTEERPQGGGNDNWQGDSGNETPKDVWEADRVHDLEPVCSVLHKSPKGHTLKTNDGDEGEETRLIDQFGQFIEMVSNVLKDENRYNNLRRGTKDVHSDPNDLEKLVEETSWVKVMNSSRSWLNLEAKKDKEKVLLRVSDQDQRRIMEIRLDNTKFKEKIEILALDKMHRITLDCTKGAEKVMILDKAKSSVIMDSLTGILTVKGATMTNVG